MAQILSEQEFYNYIFHDYRPSTYESLAGDSRFSSGVNYSYISRTRCFYVCQYIARKILDRPAEVQRVVDFGFYPGTLLRLLKELLGEKVRCFGAGLKFDKDFAEFMKPYVERCEYKEFDPFYSKGGKLQPLNFESESFDVVVATEVFEHLISPLELIAEGARLLRKKGVFIMTTPNVSHTGAVIKLIFGRSNYERLERSPMNLQNDEWRGHIRFYDKKELKMLFERYDLKLVHHRYFTERGWDHVLRTFPEKVVYLLKHLSWALPIYREGHFAIFEKI